MSSLLEKKGNDPLEINPGESADTHPYLLEQLPPDWDNEKYLSSLIKRANNELARLDGIGLVLSNPQILLEPLQLREAQISSELSGAITSPQRQLLFNNDSDRSQNAPGRDNFLEVSNYKKTLSTLSKMKDITISVDMIRDLHRSLMEGIQGEDKDPGEFRLQPVQMGSPENFVSLPANNILPLMENLVEFIHQDTPQYDPLVKAFIVFYQFEMIRPFSDGNGRMGRLLLAVMIKEFCHLSQQWLSMSSFLYWRQGEYSDRILAVSTKGDWFGWLEFCLKGVVEEAKRTQLLCQHLLDYWESVLSKIDFEKTNHPKLPLILEALMMSPVLTYPLMKKLYGMYFATAKSHVQYLVEQGVLIEVKLYWKKAKVFSAPIIYDYIFSQDEFTPVPEKTSKVQVIDPGTLPPLLENEGSFSQLVVDAKEALTHLEKCFCNVKESGYLIEQQYFVEAQMSSRLDGVGTSLVEQYYFNLDPNRTITWPKRKPFQEIHNISSSLHLLEGSQPNGSFGTQFMINLHNNVLMMGIPFGLEGVPGTYRRFPLAFGHNEMYVYPHHSHIQRFMDRLEYFIQESNPQIDPLLKALIVHYYFLAIQPFSDNNGSMGRVILAKMIQESCNLSKPWVGLSPYFSRHKGEYYDQMLAVFTNDDWNGWIEFCLLGVIDEAERIMNRFLLLVDRLDTLQTKWEENLKSKGQNLLMERVLALTVISTQEVMRICKIGRKNALPLLHDLVDAGLLEKKRSDFGHEYLYYSPEVLNLVKAVINGESIDL